jgi:hypothetical protein
MIQREKIKLIIGVPLILTVEDIRGQDATSSFTGEETRFNVLNQGTPSILYLPRAYANAIAQSGAQAGDEIQVLKTGTNGQTPTHRVRVVSDATLAAPTLPTQPIRMLAPRSQVEPAPFAPLPNERPAHQSVQQQGAAAPPIAVVMLGQCLLEAVDVALGCERYAAGKGKKLNFNEDEICRFANTLFINRRNN